MKQIRKSITQLYKKKRWLFILAVLLGVVFLLEDALLLYNRMNASRPIVGQMFNGVRYSLAKERAMGYIYQQYDLVPPLKLQYVKKTITIRKTDIGAKVDYGATINALYDTGRNGNLFQNILIQNKALFGLSNVKLVAKVSKPLLVIKVLEIEKDINKAPQPQMPDFSGDWNKTLPQKDGVKVLSSQLSEILVNRIFSPSATPITIPTQLIGKKYDAYDISEFRKQAVSAINEPISITSAGLVFTLSPTDLKSMLTVMEQPDPQNPKKTIMVLTLDRVKLSQKLEPFATQVENRTHGEFNDDNSASTAIYGQFYSNTRRLVDVPAGSALPPTVLGASTTASTSGEKTVYLTFDDGPNIIYHPLILDILKEKEVKATFYLVGSNSQLYPSTTKRTISEGHVIGDHSLTHPNLVRLLPNQIMDELKGTKTILEGFLGGDKKITLFRPPFGSTNNTVQNDANLLSLKQELWTVDPKDWSEPSTTELVNRVVNNVQNGSVVLLHSNHFATIKALPIIIDKLKAQGYVFRVQS